MNEIERVIGNRIEQTVDREVQRIPEELRTWLLNEQDVENSMERLTEKTIPVDLSKMKISVSKIEAEHYHIDIDMSELNDWSKQNLQE